VDDLPIAKNCLATKGKPQTGSDDERSHLFILGQAVDERSQMVREGRREAPHALNVLHSGHFVIVVALIQSGSQHVKVSMLKFRHSTRSARIFSFIKTGLRRRSHRGE
jgi:hypothetical protein